jgi:ketol-acid reductoisomerase
MKVYYDKDADLSLIKGKKVTILGYAPRAMRMRSTSRNPGSRSP